MPEQMEGADMPRIPMTIGDVRIDARTLDTPTATALIAAAPFESTARTWGDEVYFSTPVHVPREPDARDVVEAPPHASVPAPDDSSTHAPPAARVP